MKTASYTLMDKLNNLFHKGQFKDVMSEIRHYLITLANHARSPLVLDLLDLFKKAVDKDIDDIKTNLDVLAKLFEIPGLDVQSEILEIFAKISTQAGMKRELFDRYLSVLQERFSMLGLDSKVLAIETLGNMSNGVLSYQEATIKYLQQQLEGSEPEISREILATMTRILEAQPDLETVLEPGMQNMISQYAFETDADVEIAFETLFMHLPGSRSHISDASVQWLRSSDPRLKEKALRLIPVVIETNLDLECVDTILDNLKDADEDFESKIVETLSEIVYRNINLYLGHIVNRFLQRETEDNEQKKFIEFFALLASKEFGSVFSIIFESLDSGEASRDQLMIAIARQLNQEYPTRLETLLFKQLENFELRPVRQKIAILSKIIILVSELNSEIIIVWLARFMKKIISEPVGMDDELQRKSSELLAFLHELGTSLDEKVDQIGERIHHVEDTIVTMKNFPRMLRERGEGFATEPDLEHGVKLLDVEYHAMLEKIFSFDDFINKLDFKHLIMDLIDEWRHAKEYIIDDLNVVKSYLEDMIGKKMRGNKDAFNHDLNNLKARMEILLSEYGELINAASEHSQENESETENLASKISSFMTNSLLFDLDLTELQMNQGRESQECRKLVETWDQYTENIESKIDVLQETVYAWLEDRTRSDGNGENASVDIVALQRFFTTYARSSIKDFKTILAELQEDNGQLAGNLLLKNFEMAEKSINFRKNKLLDVIENKAHHIEKYWRELNHAAFDDLEFVVSLGRLKDEWLTAKTNMTEKVQRFFHEQVEQVDAEKLKHMLQIVNPIPIDSLKNHLKSIQGSSDVEYIEQVLDIIQKYHINAEIQDKALINVQDHLLASQHLNFVKTKATLATKGNNIEIKVMIENTSIQDIYDLVASLELPLVLELGLKTSDDKRKLIAMLEAGKNVSFTWNIKENKNAGEISNDQSLHSSKISILIGGKLFGDRYFNKVEEICFLYKST
ncbi:MAG TPA: hypothetical protein VKM55_09295 [Candidatus Lokiarchaeia archaeon]|nr:hypothetical protein [Candidatus Lokiarchaeia archaeon]